MRFRGLGLAVIFATGTAYADGSLLDDDTWNYAPGNALTADAGLVVALPAALPTGIATGVGGGFSYAPNHGVLAWGARVEGLSASESSTVWTVSHLEFRARATGEAMMQLGRATLGLRLGLGANVVDEHRTRNQGKRAGLMGDELETRALTALPAADLALDLQLHVGGHWLLALAGGPTLDLVASDLHPGWSAELGIGWRP